MAEAFPEEAADLIEVIFILRDDIETKNSNKPQPGLVIPLWFLNFMIYLIDIFDGDHLLFSSMNFFL